MQNVMLPGRATRGRSRIAGCALAILLVCAVLAIVIGLYAIVEPPRPTLPLVVITQPQPGSPVVANAPVIVFALASDPDRISKVEFLVNGQLIGAQASPKPEGSTPFETSQAWRPTKVGAYTILVRAVDTKGYSGESALLLVEAVEKGKPDPNATTQYIVEPGDSLDGIAKDFGTTPKDVIARNPELATRNPTPGDSLILPPPLDPPGPSDDAPPPGSRSPDAPPGGGPATIPPVEPPAATPPPADPVPAEPTIPPFWRGLGRLCFGIPELCRGSGRSPYLPRDLRCVISPELCLALPGTGRPAPGDPPRGDPSAVPSLDLCRVLPGTPLCPESPAPGGRAPAAPLNVRATFAPDCRVHVTWTDASDNEVGFNVWRYQGGGLPDMVGFVGPVRSTGMSAIVDDTGAGPGSAPGYPYYVVAAYNATGSTPSAPSNSVVVPISCGRSIRSIVATETVEFEAVELTVTESYERLYCYVILDDTPVDRVPRTGGQFLRLDAGRWNIADYAAGANKRVLSVPSGGALEVSAECLGWRGRELVNLGSFRKSHPPTEWDGRRLTRVWRNSFLPSAACHFCAIPPIF